MFLNIIVFFFLVLIFGTTKAGIIMLSTRSHTSDKRRFVCPFGQIKQMQTRFVVDYEQIQLFVLAE